MADYIRVEKLAHGNPYNNVYDVRDSNGMFLSRIGWDPDKRVWEFVPIWPKPGQIITCFEDLDDALIKAQVHYVDCYRRERNNAWAI